MEKKTLKTLEYPRILSALADQCRFGPAMEQARELVPLIDLEQVETLQGETAEALELLTLHPGTTVGGARDLRPITADAVRGVVLDPSRLLQVKDTLISSRNLARLMARLESEYPLLGEISRSLPESLGLVSMISSMISDEGEVLDAATPRLAQIRKDLVVQHNRLKSRMDQMLKKPEIAKHLQESIITQRNGRYVLPLKAEARSSVPGIVHDQSASGATIFVEPQGLVEANNQFRKLELDERDEVRRILSELTLAVGENAPVLNELVAVLTRMDLALARGRLAAQMNAVRPAIQPFPRKIPDGHPGVVLRLFAARHPLIDPNEVVPIDISLDKDTYALIITGPNTGGKTVTLKTVGLLVLMSQTGLHIPAGDGSGLSLFTKVYADIGDEQSLEQSLSTFSGHITNIIQILKNADRSSLVILDELGAGTDPQEGAALARSLMSNLLERGITSLVTTHHPDLKAYAHSTAGVVNASVEFDLESLKPTYHLTVGLPGRSNALAIASRLGLPDEIVKSARETLDPADLQVDDLLDDIHRQRRLAEEARQAADLARSQSEKLRVQLADRLEVIEDERIQALEKAHTENKKIVQALQDELRTIQEELEKGTEQQEELDNLADEIKAVSEVIAHSVPKRKTTLDLPKPSGPIQKGDLVYLRSLGKKGRVLSVSGDDVEIQVGVIRVRAHKADLEHSAEDLAPELTVETGTKVKASREIESPGTELDLRGQQVDEALENLEFYLDKVFLSGLPWARIIHGMGTGKLRSAVRTTLKSHPQVKSYESGKENEGGDGVTVVSFE